MLEGDDFDAEFLSVFLYCVLRVVRAIEIFSGAVFAGSGVVAADNEVGSAMVFTNDGVPYCFSRPAHAHCEGEETEDCHAVWIAGEKGLIDPHACKVVNITGFCKADYRVDKDICLTSAGCADC